MLPGLVARQSSFGLDWQGKRSRLVGLPKAVVEAAGGLDFVEQRILGEVPFVDYDVVFQFLVAF
jgi:hypothetical protein